MTNDASESDLEFLSYNDLKAARIVVDRSDLHRKQRKYGFPMPVKFGVRQARFPKRAVQRWLEERRALTAAAQ